MYTQDLRVFQSNKRVMGLFFSVSECVNDSLKLINLAFSLKYSKWDLFVCFNKM